MPTSRDVWQRRSTSRQLSTQSREWGGFYFLDRDSELMNEDGSRYPLNPDLSAALQDAIGAGSPRALNAFLQELIPSLGIGSMEDMPAIPLETLLEGILS